jgi:hypothetical protein
MDKKEAKERGIFKTAIYIGEYFEGCEKEDVWVKMREPSTQQATQFRSGENDEENMKSFNEVFINCLIDHNFEDNGVKMEPKDVFYEILYPSSSLYTYVSQEWQKALPLAKMNEQSLDK